MKEEAAQQSALEVEGMEFWVDSVQVWSTKGTCDKWYAVEEVPLTGS